MARAHCPSGVWGSRASDIQIALQQDTKMKATDGPLSGQGRLCHHVSPLPTHGTNLLVFRALWVLSQGRQILGENLVGPCTPVGWPLKSCFTTSQSQAQSAPPLCRGGNGL